MGDRVYTKARPYPKMKEKVAHVRSRIAELVRANKASGEVNKTLHDADRALQYLTEYVDYNSPKFFIGTDVIKCQFALQTKGWVRGASLALQHLRAAWRGARIFVRVSLAARRTREFIRSAEVEK